MTTTTLTSLLERIAAGDSTAFRLLHGTLSEVVYARAARTLTRAVDVEAVVTATFVEVWWLARFHTAADPGVETWIDGIVARRATERARLSGPDELTRMDDDINRVALQNLLACCP